MSSKAGIILGLIGFFLSFVSYFMYIPEALEYWPTVIGMVIIGSGYLVLFIDKVYTIYIQSLEDKKKKDDIRDLKKNQRILNIVGYVLLATFFFTIHLIPQITFRVRFYDVFAAIGYFVAVFTKFAYVPVWAAYVPLVIYYILAGSIKVFEKGVIEKLQLVARIVLAAYYGMTLMHHTQ